MAAETKEGPVPAPADAAEVSPIVALITGDKNERGIPSAVFIVRSSLAGGCFRAR